MNELGFHVDLGINDLGEVDFGGENGLVIVYISILGEVDFHVRNKNEKRQPRQTM